MMTDVILLAEVFENHRDISFTNYGLDPAIELDTRMRQHSKSEFERRLETDEQCLFWQKHGKCANGPKGGFSV